MHPTNHEILSSLYHAQNYWREQHSTIYGPAYAWTPYDDLINSMEGE